MISYNDEWAYSIYGEEYTNEFFSSKEQAIRAARIDAIMHGVESFWVGMVYRNAPYRDFTEDLSRKLLRDGVAVSPEVMDKLAKAMGIEFWKWVDNNPEYRTCFWFVENAEKYELESIRRVD